MHKPSVILLAVLILGLGVPGVAGAPSAQAPTGAASSVGSVLAPPTVQTIMSENFEGVWPSSGWTVTDAKVDQYDRYWGKEDFEPPSATAHGGTWSVWPASGGANKVDPALSVYPDNMTTHMTYGPFDLSNALDAEVTFWMWYETEVGFEDYLYFTISHGSIFEYGGQWEGTQDWLEYPISLTNFIGDDSVWVRWLFNSDPSIGLGGVFVDDITIKKSIVSISRSNADIVLNWPAIAGATSYQVWWGLNTPYFAPGPTCPSTNCASVTTLTYTHPNAVNVNSNYTYVVLPVKSAVRSAPTSRVSEFDFALIRGGS